MERIFAAIDHAEQYITVLRHRNAKIHYSMIDHEAARDAIVAQRRRWRRQ